MERLMKRFLTYVEREGPVPLHRPDLGRCWSWIGWRNQDGYGRFKVSGRKLSAHRVSYEIFPRGDPRRCLCLPPLRQSRVCKSRTPFSWNAR